MLVPFAWAVCCFAVWVVVVCLLLGYYLFDCCLGVFIVIVCYIGLIVLFCLQHILRCL